MIGPRKRYAGALSGVVVAHYLLYNFALKGE
jgi:hypothetical protein